ncbi:hypothetical protein L202_06872 [Cryptococcus amylolentus CBS 6039]|uniref:Uncharacterized protein n=1 Tax=Cryptococcus amylolentus CBS 6039 TaxID=1295533 RepID=A0A1E3HDS2_9TREE|nr:hypothetical protein L202_06872 [Cryptococcus amylolentus CBS 6039]ODN74489.1 hypothetical protein L202_06872 [Cryptococcus amylolentus CBS 6039]
MFSLPSDNNDPNHLACQPIFLTDAFCETSDSVSFFLFALTNDVFPRDKANLGQKPVKTFHASIELATKWDCPLVLRTLEGWLSRLAFERWDDDHFKPLEFFFLAAKGDMPNVARMVIELWDPVPLGEEQFKRYETVAPHWDLHLPRTTEGCEAWNPANWIHKGWSEVGLDYVFALCQCYREMDRQKRGQLFMKGLIEHSRRY